MEEKMHKGKNGFWDMFPMESVLKGTWENIDEGIVLLDASEGKILATNPQFVKITGYTEKEILNKKISEVTENINLSEWKSLADGNARQKHGLLQTQIISKDGRKQEVKIRAAILPTKSGTQNHVLLLIKTVDEDSQLLKKTNLLLSALTDINSRFISGASTQSIFNALLSTLINLTDSQFGFIGEIKYTPKGKPFLKVHSFTNIAWSEETRKLYAQYETSGLEFYNLNNLFGAAILSREPVISNDPEKDPRSKGIPPGHPKLYSFLCVPFKKGNRIIGLAGVANRPGGYNERIIEFLEPFLISCANIIDALRLEADRRKMEESLKNSLQMKDTLLREIHHRVKNNLQVIMSLINLETAREKSNNKTLQTIRNRIKAISIVHELLYQSENINVIDIKEYLLRLCENLKTAFRHKTHAIKIEYHIESVTLDINIAINIGIIVNELISNSLIHGFPENNGGVIKVDVFKTSRRSNTFHNSRHTNHVRNSNHEKILVINVSDTGVGFPATFNLETCSSLGFQLCKQLAASMDATISISKSNQFNSIVSVIIPIKNSKN